MTNMNTYRGIDRKTAPDWLGWVIIDMLQAARQNNDCNKQHEREIKIQLDYEVRLFYANTEEFA